MSVLWLEQIPNIWKIARLKTIVGLRAFRTTGSSQEHNYVGLENIESWTGRLIKSEQPTELLDDKDESKSIVSYFESGDVLFGKLRPYLAKAHLAKEAGVCTTELLVMKPDMELDGQFLLDVLLTSEFIDQVNAATFGVKMPHADWDIIGNLLIPLPPLSEQRSIAQYLDRQTAKLDTLITLKQRLLQLLAEKRRALITHAVTRGLNLDVPMRDSKIEWLGMFPGNWKTGRLKLICKSLQTGPFGSQLHAEDYIDRKDGGIPVINPAHLTSGRIVPGDRVTVNKIMAKYLAVHRLEIGDVVLARRGEIGRCGLVTDKEVGWLCGSGSLRVRPNAKILDSKYLVLLLTNTFAGSWLSLMSVGTTMDNLNTEIVGEFLIPLPPFQEQQAIVNYVEAQIAKLDKLEVVTKYTAELLQERRTALISAAVTGKIRVKEAYATQ
ncbi:restriction endonuclease subunit S [Phormidesmis sp. 146-33]